MSTEMTVVDVQGMKCPMPMLRTKKALAKLNAGESVKVLATDPHAAKDLSMFCDQTGNKMLSSEEKDGVYTFVIERKPE